MAAQPEPSLTGMDGFPSLARSAASGHFLATLVSTLAFGFSAVSFYETVIKQPILTVYVTDTLSYTRDPYGGYEVVALPVTIANGGARDGAVISLELDVKNLETGKSETLRSAYTADAQYFGGIDDYSKRLKRPKQPFAPLSITGRSAFAGTILLYTADGRRQQDELVAPNSKLQMTLRILTPEPAGWLDRYLFKAPDPIPLKVEIGGFLPGALLVGETARLKLMK